MIQQQTGRDTRDRIIRAAAKAFDELGFEGTALSNIVEQSGLSKGALYFHFSSKEEIALAVIEMQHSTELQAVQIITTEDHSPLEKMLLMCAHLAQRLSYEPVVRAGIRLATDSSILDPSVESLYEDWIITFEALSNRAMDIGELTRNVEANVLSNFIIPAFTGVQMVSDLFTQRQNVVQRISEMWMILIRATVPLDALEETLKKSTDIFANAGALVQRLDAQAKLKDR